MHAFYKSAAWQRCRSIVLARDPICKVCGFALSKIADHFPRTLRAFLEAGDEAGAADPAHSRGVCEPCHNTRSGSQSREAQRRTA